MKKLWILSILILALLLAACGGQPTAATQSAAENPSAEPAAENSAAGEETPDEPGLRHAEITVRDYGVIKLELNEKAAPITVANFVKLAQEGFYDGLTFHRIMDGFMIQGGDPLGNGTGGSSESIQGEFSLNGFDNPISHVKGVISMARAQDPNSATSQFFITVDDADFLDGSYAAFGWVTEGMDVVEQIARDARPIDNNGTIPPEEQPVIESIVVLD